jgi:enoyl-CoA hydratase
VIETSVDGDVRTIKLNRPDRCNALTRDGLDQLLSVIEDATEPVLYIHGSADCFSAGADLSVVDSLDSDEGEDFAKQGQRVTTAIENYDGAVVAGVDGAAIGGGVELALACDLRIATPEATFAESGVNLGLFGPWGGTTRLCEILGQGEALDLALSGRMVDADEALRIGLVTRIVDDPRDVADTIAEKKPEAVRTIKNLLRSECGREMQEEREASAFATLVESAHPRSETS